MGIACSDKTLFMDINKKSRRQLRLQSWAFLILFLAVMGLLATISVLYHAEFDWTATGRHTLSEASIKVLERMPEPLLITSYQSGGDTSPERLRVKDLIKRYQKHKANIELKFVDPITNPDIVRELGIRMNGEMIANYTNRSEHITSFDETSLTNSLQRMLRSAQRPIVFISGHRERDPLGQANHDLGAFFTNLGKKGLPTKKVNLAQERAIPADTTVLAIAGPETDYLDWEIKLIKEYLDRGGNLLWLHDPLSKVNLPALATHLGIKFEPGIIIDLEVSTVGIKDPTIVMAAEYPAHVITQNFSFITLFPRVAAIETKDQAGWQYSPILHSIANSWLEKGELTKAVRFDQQVDKQGPINFGVAGQREINNGTDTPSDKPKKTAAKMQRLVVLGDGDFLSNAFLGNQGNQQLGENIINWLAQDDNFIDIPPTTAPGSKLTMSETNWALLGAFFFLALPATLIGTGVFIWLRRRRR